MSLNIFISNIYAGTLNVPGVYANIQAALNAASSGDVVYVQPGTYTENIVWPNINGIKLISAGDNTNTTIDGNSSGTVIRFSGGFTFDNTNEINGFKITNGSGYTSLSLKYGGGIYLEKASPELKNLDINQNSLTGLMTYGGGISLRNGSDAAITNTTISNNTTNTFNSDYGGGVYCEESDPIFTDVTISNNTLSGPTSETGGGIYIAEDSGGSNPVLTRVIISGNDISASTNVSHGGGIYVEDNCTLTCTNVLISDNIIANSGPRGGGIYIDGGSVTLTNVTISGNRKQNSGAYDGGGIYISISGGTATLKNVISWNTTASNELYKLFSGTYTVTYSDIKGGYAGTQNINSDPSFVNAGSGDYRIQSGSPCEDEGTATGAPTDDLNKFTRTRIPDIGAYEVGSAPAPIELLLFYAICKNSMLYFYWQTASELNNDFFTLEQSLDAINWEVIKTINGAGNSNCILNYSYEIPPPYDNTAYYRLKQTDYDGSFEYSNVISAICEYTQVPLHYKIYPNPANILDNPVLFLEGLEPEEEILILVRDVYGRLLFSRVFLSNNNGSVLEALDTQKQLSPGIYYIVGANNDEIYGTKLIIY